jgi:lipoate-protein ligase B
LTYQNKLVSQRHSWSYDLLVLLEHPAVITLGRNSNDNNLVWTQTELDSAGIDCVSSRRGGDVTLHAPGQLVGYPIVDLNYYQRDLHKFLRDLEAVLIATLRDFKLAGKRQPGKTGVWIDERKIASIGIAVQRWISYHGFALNVNNDLSSFEAIVPCGLQGVSMTSMQQERDKTLDMRDVTESLIFHFGRIMQRPLLGEFDGETSEPQA